ncbi:MAG TPA: phosphoribosyltransferase family protein [Puia sp.]|jgi:pyrimidine operon attenuation protein/uracil phosphoribosyltransferase|nr:phosphoribosyltransferase family protein [Puia sp.]
MKNYILTEAVAEKKLRRMAYEILENNPGEKELILAGIRESGSVIARNIQRLLQEIAGSRLSVQLISITLDKKMPSAVTLSGSPDFTDAVIIVIDDVANSGKTLLYALKPFLEFHPRKIESLVLVERTHKAFPVQPDYTGLSLSTTLQEHIYVEVDGDLVKGAWLE